MQAEMLSILRCPEDRSPLTPAGAALISRLNAAIRAGSVVDRKGKRLKRAIEGGLIRTDGTVLYPIVEQIPVLLRDDAIPLDQLGV